MKWVTLGADEYANTIKDVAVQLDCGIVAIFGDKLKGLELSKYRDYIFEDVVFIPAFGSKNIDFSGLINLRFQMQNLQH